MRMKKLLKFTFFVLFPAALVLVLAFFFLTGSFFLTTVALPFLSSRAGVEITAERVELSVFRSRVRVEKLRVGAEKSPIFQAARAEGGFDWAMLAGGAPKLEDVTLDGAALTLYHTGNGSWNVFPPAAAEMPPDKSATPSKKPRKPFRIDLSRVTVRDSRLRLIFGDPEAGSAFE